MSKKKKKKKKKKDEQKEKAISIEEGRELEEDQKFQY
jgi:hypothetical protein